MRILVRSHTASLEASRLLEEVAATIESQRLGTVEKTVSQVPGTKGITVSEIVIQLALGAAGNAVYDLIKALIARGVQRLRSRELAEDSVSVWVEPEDSQSSPPKSE